MMKLTLLKSLCLMLVGTAFTTHAAVNTDRTRIVFPESDKASSLKIENQSKALPYLALSGLKMRKAVKKTAISWRCLRFNALKRVPHHRSGSLSKRPPVSYRKTENPCFISTCAKCPESTSASDERSVMQVAMQSRIKLFWRPKAITKNPASRLKCGWKFQLLRKG